MWTNLIKSSVYPRAWKALTRWMGEPPEMEHVRLEFDRVRRSLEEEMRKREKDVTELHGQLETTRDERLQWMARESATRKELQDCQERNKDLLEQVVRLTHLQREAKKNLLDEKFRTSTTPLERTRFEMEMAEARGNARRAEERAKAAEEKMAVAQARQQELEREAARRKELESELDWARAQAAAHLQALGAAIVRIKALEDKAGSGRRTAVRAKGKGPRSYRRPSIRPARPAQQAAFTPIPPATPA